MESMGLILAIALASVHAFMSRLPIFSIIPRFRWISFAGGVSISFVFLEIFPELSHAKEKLEHTEIPLVHHIKNQTHFVALIGLLVFYGLGLFAARTKLFGQSALNKEGHRSAIFWIHISGFAILNVIFGYLLYDLSEHSLKACIMFF